MDMSSLNFSIHIFCYLQLKRTHLQWPIYLFAYLIIDFYFISFL